MSKRLWLLDSFKKRFSDIHVPMGHHGSKQLHFGGECGGVWIKVPKDCGRNEEGRVLFAVEVVVSFIWNMLKYVEVVDTAKFLTSILIRFGQLRSYCNKNNQKLICSIMLKLVFQIELFVTNNCPSEWHEGTRTSPSSSKRNLIWRWRSSQNNMLGKPVIPGCGLAVEFFPTQKNDEFFDSMQKTLLLASKPPKIAKDPGPGCLAWLGLWSNQGNERMFEFMFEGSGFPKLFVFCMVNDVHWM